MRFKNAWLVLIERLLLEVREGTGLLLETGGLPEELGNHESSRWMKS